jgi:hypothetical protein
MDGDLSGHGRRLMQPTIFSGGRDEDPCAWLDRYLKAARYNRWDHNKALRRVGLFLSGTAEAWFEAKEDTFTTWNDFQTAFEAKYLDKTYEEQAWNALQAFKMTKGQTVEEVVMQMYRLFRRARVTDKTTRLRLFRQALPSNYQQELIKEQPATFEEAADYAAKLERIDHLFDEPINHRLHSQIKS